MKKIILLFVVLSLSACSNITTETQVIREKKTNGEPDAPHTSAEWKIWALSTAAPSFIAAKCTVLMVVVKFWSHTWLLT